MGIQSNYELSTTPKVSFCSRYLTCESVNRWMPGVIEMPCVYCTCVC
jgi:hypothetical protein